RSEFPPRHLRRLLPVVVEPPVIGEPPRAIEDVEIRRAHGAEGTRDLLRFVDEIWKAVALLPPAGEKPRRRVVGIARGVVGADADELNAPGRVRVRERDQTILDRL